MNDLAARVDALAAKVLSGRPTGHQQNLDLADAEPCTDCGRPAVDDLTPGNYHRAEHGRCGRCATALTREENGQ